MARKEVNMTGLAKTNCKFCGSETFMTSTKLCNNCWEVESRVARIPNKVLVDILGNTRVLELFGIVTDNIVNNVVVGYKKMYEGESSNVDPKNEEEVG